MFGPGDLRALFVLPLTILAGCTPVASDGPRPPPRTEPTAAAPFATAATAAAAAAPEPAVKSSKVAWATMLGDDMHLSGLAVDSEGNTLLTGRYTADPGERKSKAPFLGQLPSFVPADAK